MFKQFTRDKVGIQILLGMDESFQSVEVLLVAKNCGNKPYHTTAKVCVPWTRGFERFHHIR